MGPVCRCPGPAAETGTLGFLGRNTGNILVDWSRVWILPESQILCSGKLGPNSPGSSKSNRDDRGSQPDDPTQVTSPSAPRATPAALCTGFLFLPGEGQCLKSKGPRLDTLSC